MKRLLLMTCLSAAGLLAGCSSSAGTTASGAAGAGAGSAAQPVVAAPAPPRPTVVSCPTVAKARFAWPATYPKDLPQPPAATLTGTSTTRDGLTLTRFTTAQSLQESVVFVVKELKKAGYDLGRGDAEPTEADAPFGKGDVRGVMKMLATEQCSTSWLVAVTRQVQPGANNSPLLPTPYHSTSPSPLPFG